ncbi:MAG: alpha/beta hydrolase [Chitinophagaceae bacterium]|nr:alpha/beta hydrolase [Chitinophagaceae bacterium]
MKQLIMILLVGLLHESLRSQTTFEQFEHGKANVNGISMHYRKAGTGKSVLLLHGWPQHSLMWHAVAPKLVDAGYQVIAPDMRGVGGSSIPDTGYDKKTMAEDVYQLLQQLKINKLIIAGYDLGSNVAYSLAAAHPEIVEKIVVMEFGMPGFGYEEFMAPNPQWDNSSNWHLSLFTLPDIAVMAFQGKEQELLSWFFWHLSYNASAVSATHFNEYLKLLKRPGALRAGVMYYANVWKDAKNNKELAKVKLKMPMLAVGGEASGGQWISQLFQPLAEKITALVIPKAGHWLGDENPEFLANELINFFKK